MPGCLIAVPCKSDKWKKQCIMETAVLFKDEEHRERLSDDYFADVPFQ